MIETLDCLAVVRQLWDYLDDELSPERWASVEAHLSTCSGCHEHVVFCRSLVQGIESMPIDPSEVAAMRKRIEAVLAGPGETPT
ncbi:MAG: zf-HC2 domain-containing protein [bacterium]